MADVESGLHHHAAGILRATGMCHQTKLGSHEKPVLVRYSKQPWGIYHVIPPTARLVSAWRKVA